MRILLSIIFFFFILLIAIENAIRKSISFLKNLGKKTIDLFNPRSSPLFKHNVPKLLFSSIQKYLPKPSKKKKRKKETTLSLFPHRTKVKYFFLGTFFAFFFLFLPLVFVIFVQELPSPRELSLRHIPQTTRILDRNGTLLAEMYTTQNRTLIPLSDVPKHLQQATLAIEDKNFYKHPGFDMPSIIRAFQSNISGNKTQGGSTITQQLIKSSMLTPEQNITRKVKEVVLAFWAERIYTKEQILEMYFNQVPYGGTAWGVEAASETYFSKPVKQLSLAESAFLAGLTAAPTTYSPYGTHPDAWKTRQKEVLKRMVESRYISTAQAEKAAKEKLTFKRQQAAIHAPHFVVYIKELLIQKYGLGAVEKGGLTIKTSLDLKTQQMAEKIVKDEVDKSASLNLTNGAALVTDPQNGDIIAMVGSHDFSDPNGGNVNITTSLRQPGSSIKVVTYAAALAQGLTAATLLDDSPVSYPSDSGTYSPVNYDGRYHGKVPLRLALANSYNITAVRLLDQIGVPTMVNLGKDMGIKSYGDPKNYGLSVTLGAGEVTMIDMASVYGTLSNNGWREEINPILKINDAKGSILEEKKGKHGQQILPKAVSFIISDILADNAARSLAFGNNSPLHIPGHTVSVKTGTTDNKRDNWTDGYTNNFVTIVWVGNNDNSPMSPNLTSGITGAAPIWNKIMTNLLKTNPEKKPIPPVEVVQKRCYGKLEYFVKGTENNTNCGTFNAPSGVYSAR